MASRYPDSVICDTVYTGQLGDNNIRGGSAISGVSAAQQPLHRSAQPPTVLSEFALYTNDEAR